jgi:hypothetical protein
LEKISFPFLSISFFLLLSACLSFFLSFCLSLSFYLSVFPSRSIFPSLSFFPSISLPSCLFLTSLYHKLGGGGALLREKMVEVVSDKFICIVDESKLSKGLGPGFPLPVEITPFCHEHTLRLVQGLPSVKGCKAVLRMGSIANNKNDGPEIAVTDNGNYIVDLFFETAIVDVALAAREIKATVGE